MANRNSATENKINRLIENFIKNLESRKEAKKTLRMTFNEQTNAVKNMVDICAEWMDANYSKNSAAMVNDILGNDVEKYEKKSDAAYHKFCRAAKKIAKVKVTPSSPENFKTLSKAIDHLGYDYSEKSLWQNLRPVVRALNR